MPLQHGLRLKEGAEDQFPLQVILTLSGGDKLRCCVQRSKRHDRFHITLEPGHSLPQVVLDSMARDKNNRPVGLISVCVCAGGHDFLSIGQEITLSYTAKSDFPVTVEAGTLEGIALP
jgi:hypothetical protein